MPNGGLISCTHCHFAAADARCEIFGTDVSPSLLCRMFRLDAERDPGAHRRWAVLQTLEPGVIYEIDNSYPASGAPPRAVFRVLPQQQG